VNRASGIVVGLLVAAGLALLGASFFYRVVRTPWGTVLLEKPQPSFGASYVDTRKWGPRDFIKHWALSKQLMEKGLEHVEQHPPR
jgi:hypothetical protein